MAEFYRQFAFVSSVLAGFACAFYGAFLAHGSGRTPPAKHRTASWAAPAKRRAASWAALFSASASVAFLIVTLGTTFAAAKAANAAGGSPPHAVLAQRGPLSMFFLTGILLLLVSFGIGGWTRSRRLGFATTAVALLGGLGAFWALLPFLHVY